MVYARTLQAIFTEHHFLKFLTNLPLVPLYGSRFGEGLLMTSEHEFVLRLVELSSVAD